MSQLFQATSLVLLQKIPLHHCLPVEQEVEPNHRTDTSGISLSRGMTVFGMFLEGWKEVQTVCDCSGLWLKFTTNCSVLTGFSVHAQLPEIPGTYHFRLDIPYQI